MKGSVTVVIRRIDGIEAILTVDRRCSGKSIWTAYTKMLGIKYPEFFGLQFDSLVAKGVKNKSGGGSYALGKPPRQWLVPSESVETQLGTPRLGADGKSHWDLDFRARYYVDKVLLDLWCPMARFLFYMQLRDDVFSDRIPMKPEQVLFLAGLASQVHFGDFAEDRNLEVYFSQIDSAALRRQGSSVGQKVAAEHRQHVGMTRLQAMKCYLEHVAMSPMYGMDLHDCANVHGNSPQEPCKLGISPSGIAIFDKASHNRVNLPWINIKNISHNKKRLTLVRRCDYAPDSTYEFLFDNKADCKSFLEAAIQQHVFFRQSESARKQIEARKIAQSVLYPMKHSLQQADGADHKSPTLVERRSLADITGGYNAISAGSIQGYEKQVGSPTSDQDRSVWIPQNSQHAEGFEVVLRLGDGEKLGISIAGGLVEGENSDVSSPIHIQQVVTGGAAHRDGSLCDGDILLTINDVLLDGMFHSDVVKLIETETASGQIRMRVWREVSSLISDLVVEAKASSATDRADASTIALRGSIEPNESYALETTSTSHVDESAIQQHTIPQSEVNTSNEDGDTTVVVDEMAVPVGDDHEAVSESTPRMTSSRLTTRHTTSDETDPCEKFESKRSNEVARALLTLDGGSINDGMPDPPFFVQVGFTSDPSFNSTNGLSFTTGDILEIIEFADENVWIGRHLRTCRVGELPSLSYAKRFKYFNQEAPPADAGALLPRCAYELMNHQSAPSSLSSSSAIRPIALFGCNIDAVAAAMVSISEKGHSPIGVCHPVFHTTRTPRPGEISGIDYHYISESEMKLGLKNKLFAEAGSFAGHLYALSFADILNTCKSGKSVVLQTKMKAVSRLTSNTGLRPVIVYIQKNRKDRGTKSALTADQSDFKSTYGLAISHVVREGITAEATAATVLKILKKSVHEPYWTRSNRSPQPDEGNAVVPELEMKPTCTYLNQVTFRRNTKGSFGFSITGGIDYGIMPSISRIYDVKLQDTSLCDPAVGDYILAVNGECVTNAMHDETADLLKHSSESLVLTLFPVHFRKYVADTETTA